MVPPISTLPPLTLVLGGARSGKSAYAESLFSGIAEPIYLATAETRDDEMRRRVALHRERRGPEWRTLEEPLDLVGALVQAAAPGTGILIDCITMWLSNLMEQGGELEREFENLSLQLSQLPAPVVMVSNEVGYGIVPDNALARAFRDHAGLLNQRLAGLSQRVVLVAAGLPLMLKNNVGEGHDRPAPALMEE